MEMKMTPAFSSPSFAKRLKGMLGVDFYRLFHTPLFYIMLVISGIISFLVLTARQAKELLPYAGLYMIVVTIVYFSGILNPVARELSNINKLLKKYPHQYDLRKYLNEDQEKE